MRCHLISDTRAPFLSLPPWPCGWRDALCNQVSCRGHGWQAIPHVVRGVLCEGDEGTAEVRDQHRLPPSASAVTLNCFHVFRDTPARPDLGIR